MYVANRGNGTIVRMRQDGIVVAMRRIELPNGEDLGAGPAQRDRGLARCPADLDNDQQRDTRIIRMRRGPCLKCRHLVPRMRVHSIAPMPSEATASDLVTQGARLFVTDFTPEQGLGPLYNRRACVQCHLSPTTGGMGWDGLALVQRVGRFDSRIVRSPLRIRRTGCARKIDRGTRGACDLMPGPPANANLISVRNAPPLYGLGLIDRDSGRGIRAQRCVKRHQGAAAYCARSAR